MKIHGINGLSLLDYPGRMACTIFTGHCNFRCPFCHNGTLVLNPDSQPLKTEEELFELLKNRAGRLEGIAITLSRLERTRIGEVFVGFELIVGDGDLDVEIDGIVGGIVDLDMEGRNIRRGPHPIIDHRDAYLETGALFLAEHLDGGEREADTKDDATVLLEFLEHLLADENVGVATTKQTCALHAWHDAPL